MAVVPVDADLETIVAAQAQMAVAIAGESESGQRHALVQQLYARLCAKIVPERAREVACLECVLPQRERGEQRNYGKHRTDHRASVSIDPDRRDGIPPCVGPAAGQ